MGRDFCGHIFAVNSSCCKFAPMIEMDKQFMRRALQLARQGGGHTSPNPMVGAVIVHDGRIIGEGFHRCCGQAHAEVNAVNSVSDRGLLPLSTLYVTLEPCSHHGKTPPCAQMLIEHRIGRVVVGMLDPFEKVSGRGVAQLREAGVEVEVGVLADRCRSLNERFVTAHTLHRPWVQLKWAQTADGFIGLPPEDNENPLHISTAVTMALMHRERALCDAIVVGARTVAIDNPSLTTRRWPGSSPLRVVLDRSRSIPADSKVVTDGLPTIVYNASLNKQCGPVEWVAMDTDSPDSWLADLYRRGITSVMVEGGTQVLSHLLEAGVWDEARIEVSPREVHRGVEAPRWPLGSVVGQRVDGNTLTWIKNDVKKV